MKKIIVPTDFTIAAANAVKQATVVAVKSKADLVLLHVVDAKSHSEEELKKTLTTESAKISDEYKINCSFLLKTGNISDVIACELNQITYDLMVIGMHGSKGIRQKLFGSDILKLAIKVPIPLLVVQKDTEVADTFKKIILPVGSHEGFRMAVNAVLYFSGIFNSEVHLYSINKPGFDWPEQMKKNIDMTMNIFESKATPVVRVKEDQNMYSVGYAKQTLNYAKSVNADAICMMSVPSAEYYYIAQSDKETMMENEFHIPVLFAGSGI
jgi:nucleotide-binding universal stress UspA family protein